LVSLTLREEHLLRVFEKRMLRRIFGPKSEEVAGGCRRLHNEERHNLYALPNTNISSMIKSRRMSRSGHVTGMGEGSACRMGRDHLEDLGIDGRVILDDLRETEWERVDCIHLAQDRDQWRAVVNALMKLCLP
jgi:hypothetical protein